MSENERCHRAHAGNGDSGIKDLDVEVLAGYGSRNCKFAPFSSMKPRLISG